MSGRWQDVPLSAAPLEIIDGDRGKNYPQESDFSDSGYCLFLSARNVTPTGFNFSSCQFIDQAKDRALRKGRLSRGDVVMTTRGTVGNVAHFDMNVPYPAVRINSGMVIFRTDPRKLSPAFLYHFLRSPNFRDQVLSVRSGTAQPQLPIKDMQGIRMPLPDVATQSRISSILSAYDSLIENNTRRIQILEEMAQAIYREWFVEFRFPGHEGVRKVDSELGPIPEGWIVVPASTALDIDPTLKPDPASVRPFVPMTSVSERTMHIEPIECRQGSAGSKFENGDTLLARITPCLENGKTAFVQGLAPGVIGSGSTEFIVLRSRLLTPELTYLLARSDPFRAHAIKSMSGATGRQRVRPSCFDSYLLGLPPEDLQSRFRSMVAPMFALSYALFRMNQNLHTTRDLLLPRLISGEIDVSSLDIGDAEPAA